MQVIATELYGIVGMFFTTNMRYELPKHSYRDQPMDSSEESSSSESDDEVIRTRSYNSRRCAPREGGTQSGARCSKRTKKESVGTIQSEPQRR